MPTEGSEEEPEKNIELTVTVQVEDDGNEGAL